MVYGSGEVSGSKTTVYYASSSGVVVTASPRPGNGQGYIGPKEDGNGQGYIGGAGSVRTNVWGAVLGLMVAAVGFWVWV